MKLVLIAVVALVAVAVAAPQGYPAPPTLQAQELPKVIRSEFDQQANGGYIVSRMTSTAGHRPPPKISTMASFETENGIQRQEKVELKKVVDEENKPQSVVVVKGSYSYIDSEGNPLTINYYVDETGFHAEGDAIPKTPVARR